MLYILIHARWECNVCCLAVLYTGLHQFRFETFGFSWGESRQPAKPLAVCVRAPKQSIIYYVLQIRSLTSQIIIIIHKISAYGRSSGCNPKKTRLHLIFTFVHLKNIYKYIISRACMHECVWYRDDVMILFAETLLWLKIEILSHSHYKKSLYVVIRLGEKRNKMENCAGN